MIWFVVLWGVCIVLSFVGYVFRACYSPARKMADLCLTLLLLAALGTQLAAIYHTALRSALLAMLAVVGFDYYWFYFSPFHPNSDPAGNGMARAFRSIVITMAALFLSLISFLLIKFLTPGGTRLGLYLVLVVAAWIGLYNIWADRDSFLSGSSLDMDARWARMHIEDYRKSLIRMSMVEKGDSWEAKELDANPKELEHWDVYGCKSIIVRTWGLLPCSLLEGKFEFPDRTAKVRRSGFCAGCLGYTDEGDANDRTVYMPSSMTLAWYDASEDKAYKIQTDLPKELDRYFEDTDRFWLDDIELRILPWGRVWMYHNRQNQIHNIMIEYPLVGAETDEYGERNEGLSAIKGIKVPTADTISNYLKRFKYTIVFRSDDARFKITKTICNFFNGEKTLTDGEWKEDIDPARIKDVFLRFEDEKSGHAAFIYFDEEEILKAFREAFAEQDDSEVGEFVISCGDTKDAFSFTLTVGDRSVMLEKTEIRLYRVNSDERGKLIFKNYKGNHQNRLSGLEIRLPELHGGTHG
ncbi:MAG: hypothetical protein IK125_07630 [Lachnospiraceae bacterium]|nr:hypothetical protein [Lachnospiraceae bacterium]